MEWEKIVANDATDKGLISKRHKQLIQLNNNNMHPYIHWSTIQNSQDVEIT